MPLASTTGCRLVPFLARSVGFGPVFFSPKRCLGHRTVGRKKRPIDAPLVIVVMQKLRPQPSEHSRLGPFDKAPVSRSVTAQSGRVECAPLTARPQDKQDRIHRTTVGYARIVTAQWVGFARWQQRFDLRPQSIRNPPTIVGKDEPHRDTLLHASACRSLIKHQACLLR
jgi:hypothetical protein